MTLRLRLGFTLLLLMFAVRAAAQAPHSASWNDGLTLGVRADQTKGPNGLYIVQDGLTAAWNQPGIPLPANQWITVDLSDSSHWGGYDLALPADIKAIFLAGTLITSGWPNTYCSLTLTFRRDSAVAIAGTDYQIAAVSAVPGAAFRQQVMAWVPVIDRHYDVYWQRGGDANCPTIIQLALQAYAR